MKRLTFLALVQLSAFSCSAYIFAQSSALAQGGDPTIGKVNNYVLRIESTDPGKANVRFSGTFAFGDSAHQAVITSVEKATPFTMTFSAEYFVGLFQDKSKQGKIKVHLARVDSGNEIEKVDGQDELNVLSVFQDQISFGWPHQARSARRR